jgi:hypothetical protein
MHSWTKEDLNPRGSLDSPELSILFSDIWCVVYEFVSSCGGEGRSRRAAQLLPPNYVSSGWMQLCGTVEVAFVFISLDNPSSFLSVSTSSLRQL